MKKILILFIFGFALIQSKAQQTTYTNGYTMSGTNAYKTINTQLFVTPAGSSDPNPTKHFLTVLKRSYKIKSMFTGGETPIASPVLDNGATTTTLNSGQGLKMWKKKFTKDIIANVVIIRPNDNLSRPCILLTPGVVADFSKISTNLYMGAADLAMRGYVVAFYEHGASLTFLANNFGAILAGNLASDAYVNSHPVYSGLNQFFKEVIMPSYLGWQVNLALQQYITLNSASFNIDNNWLFAAGHSAGAGFSLQLAYAEIGINFTHEYYNPFKPDNRYCISTAPLTRNIKAVVAIDGALREDTSNMTPGFFGKMITANDANIPALFLHGKNDNSVNFNQTIHTVPLWFNDNGPLILKSEITNLTNSKAQINLNCESGHGFGTLFNILKFTGTGISTTPVYTLSGSQDDLGPFATAMDGLPEPTYAQLKSTDVFVTNNKNNFYKSYSYISEMEDACFFISSFLSERMFTYGAMVNSIKYTNSVSSYTNLLSTKFLAPLTTTVCAGLNPQTLRQSNPNPTTEIKTSNLPIIYPNPTTGKLNINLQLDKAIDGYSVSIFSVDGRSIYNKSVTEKMEATQTLQQNLDISEQPNGVYFVRITSENNVLLNKTFVLNK